MVLFLGSSLVLAVLLLAAAWDSRCRWQKLSRHDDRRAGNWKAAWENMKAEAADLANRVKLRDARIGGLEYILGHRDSEIRILEGQRDAARADLAAANQLLDESEACIRLQRDTVGEQAGKLDEYRAWTSRLCKGIVDLDALLDHGPR